MKEFSREIEDYIQAKYKVSKNASSSLFEKRRNLTSLILGSEIPQTIEYEKIPYQMGAVKFTVLKLIKSMKIQGKDNFEHSKINPQNFRLGEFSEGKNMKKDL